MGFLAVAVVLAVEVHRVAGELNLDRIAERIAQAEAKTTGEIVCVLARQSDEYKYIPVLWAAIAALAVPMLFMIYEWLFVEYGSYVDTQFGLSTVYICQLLAFLVAYFIVQWRATKFWLVPKSVKMQRAKRLAAEQFMMQEIHLTDDRTGVLLFVSLGEHYAEVIADHGIYDKLDNAIWQKLIDELIGNIKQGNMSEGLEQAIDEIGILLAEHFPAKAENRNELANHLILID